VGEGFNEPPNSKGCNQCGIITHTHKLNKIHENENMPLLLGNAVGKGKASKWEPWHKGEKIQSSQQRQMLVGDREETSTKRPKGCLRWKMV